MIGNLLNRSVDERLAGSIAAALYALAQGARIIRVHDVQATSDAVKVFWRAQQYQTSHINQI
jgi:dihydropteroate synthase